VKIPPGCKAEILSTRTLMLAGMARCAVSVAERSVSDGTKVARA
jgi:hypothetical protein